ncbi:MAG: hypothetical protein JNK58_04415 [Phycisphaerae bacterium]|nr:hypothetical protein [Phycisphaerae bacterium]
MSTGKIIKSVLICGSLSMALWQAAQFMEVLGETKSQQKGRRPASLLGGLSLTALQSAGAGQTRDLPAALNQLAGAEMKTGGEGAAEIVVYSADGRRMTPAQIEALRREAERNRPRVRETTP